MKNRHVEGVEVTVEIEARRLRHAAALKERADAIGMSGLLVKSTLVMRDNLEELNARELWRFPVILGGAALTAGSRASHVAMLARARGVPCASASDVSDSPYVAIIDAARNCPVEIIKFEE